MFVVITTHFHFSLILMFYKMCVVCLSVCERDKHCISDVTIGCPDFNFLQNACIFPVGDQIALYMREWF